MKKEMQQQYGDEVGAALNELLAEAIESDGPLNMDNQRWCEVGVESEEAAYEQQKDDGCCGSVDKVVEVNGRKFRIGFNYGH